MQPSFDNSRRRGSVFTSPLRMVASPPDIDQKAKKGVAKGSHVSQS